jgi:hypothetical protein
MSSTAYTLLERIQLSEGTEAVERKNQPTTLTAVLAGLALQPFSAAAVERYKQEKAKEANAWLWLHRALLGLPHLCAVYIIFGLALFCAAGGLVPQHDAPRGYALTGLAILLVSALTLIMIMLDWVKVKDRAVWEVVPYPDYQGTIPETAYLNMCEIVANLPEVDFAVHRLVQNRKTLDPFMEARYGDESYFIAVWDETYTA